LATIYGFQCDTTRITTTAVDGVSLLIAAANIKRRKLFIVNTSTHDLYITFGGVCAETSATLVLPKGTSYSAPSESLWIGDISSVKVSAGVGLATVVVTECE